MLKAGPMYVLYKIRYKGVKAVVCRYLDMYCYFFAMRGEVYIDYVMPPNRKELRAHKTTLNEIEPKLISHLCAKAQENIEFQIRKGRWEWYNKLKEKYAKPTARWFVKLKSRLIDAALRLRRVEVPGGRPEGLGSEHASAAGQAPEAAEVR